MSIYLAVIAEATGRTERYELSLIEADLRDTYGPLDGFTRDELADLARASERLLTHIGHLEPL